MSQQAPGTIGQFLDAIMLAPADKTSYLILAAGRDPYLNDKGKYRHHDREELPFLWPARRDDAITQIEQWAPTCDMYCCPYPQKTAHRPADNAAWRQIIHSDVDGDADELRAKVRKLGSGFIVWSGTPGHGHAYFPLEHCVTSPQHKRLCEGLRDYLGADSKIRENDLMRIPGTRNFKPTLQGLPPAPVEAEKP